MKSVIIFLVFLSYSVISHAEVVMCETVANAAGRDYETKVDHYAISATSPVHEDWTLVDNVKGYQIIQTRDALLTQCWPEKIKHTGLSFKVWPVLWQRSKQSFAVVAGKLWVVTDEEESLPKVAQKFPLIMLQKLPLTNSASFNLKAGEMIEEVMQDLSFSPLINNFVPVLHQQRYRIR